MWVVVNADAEESREAGQDPLIGPKKKKDDLPRSEFGPWKIPCVYLFYFFSTAQEQREDYLFVGEGEKKKERKNPLQLINLVN